MDDDGNWGGYWPTHSWQGPILEWVEGCRFHPGIGPCETCGDTGYMPIEWLIEFGESNKNRPTIMRVECPFGCEGGEE